MPEPGATGCAEPARKPAGRNRIVDIHAVYRLFQGYFRPRRMKRFRDLVGLKPHDRIIDLGGTRLNWEYLAEEPEITIVNIDIEERDEGRFRFVNGDARDLPMPDDGFDIAFSNSVIEHVGSRAEQERFARETRRIAPRYFVQTPNRRFFFEPHLIAAFVHFFPRPVMRRLLPFFSVWYWVNRPSHREVEAFLDDINLLTEADMRELFPDAEIVRERFLGMTKSIIAVRR